MEYESIYGPYADMLPGILGLMIDRITLLGETMRAKRGVRPWEHLSGRVKTEKSMRDKLSRLGLEESPKAALTGVYDAVGIRVVCRFLNDIYQVADALRHMDGVRVGSAFLGRLNFKDKLGLKKIGYVECTVEEMRWIPKGQTVGYSAGFKAKSQLRTAVIGIGYYNGFAMLRQNDLFRFRDSILGILHHIKNIFFPHKILVNVNGQKCRILGHVGMVHAVVDVTDIDCAVGDKVIAAVNPLMVKGLRVQYR